MNTHRKLSLNREPLAEIDAPALRGVGGGQTITSPTQYSCLDYISCWYWQCLLTYDACGETQR